MATRPFNRAPEVDNEVTQIILQMDELQRIASVARRESFGEGWFRELRDLYNVPLTISTSTAPSFRPRITIPQLQMLCLQEASELVDSDPKIYIINERKGRIKERESVMQSLWRHGLFNLQLMYAEVWALLHGTGFVQCGFDAYANRGKGSVWVRSRDPETVFPDPFAADDLEWNFVMWEDRVWPDEMMRRFPERGRLVRLPEAPPQPQDSLPFELGYGLQFTPGPMSVTGGLPEERGPSDGRVRLRYLLLYDSTAEEVIKKAGGSKEKTDSLVPAKFKLKYPNGRLIIEGEGVVLYDGDNPYPLRRFPLIRVCSLPPITGFWCPSPVRYLRELQYTAQKMLTQTFENAVRLNNGVWFIDESTGLSPEDFGGIPAEVRVINSQSRYPELKFPKPFPQHFLQYPQFLLSLLKDLMGFTASRQGQPGAGNVGSDLFDASVFQSQALTRMRAKLLVAAVQNLAEQVFGLMSFLPDGAMFPQFGGQDQFSMIKWEEINEPEDFGVHLDPGSIRPISGQALRRMVPQLKQLGLLDSRTALEMLDIPGAPEIADNVEAERALEALARVKRGR